MTSDGTIPSYLTRFCRAHMKAESMTNTTRLGVGGARACDERTRERLLEVLPELNDLHVREEVGVDLVEQSALLLDRKQRECRAAATCLVRLSRRIDTLLELDAHRPPLVELEVARFALQRDVRMHVVVRTVLMCQKVEHPRALLQDSVVLEHEVRLERLALGVVVDDVNDAHAVIGSPVHRNRSRHAGGTAHETLVLPVPLHLSPKRLPNVRNLPLIVFVVEHLDTVANSFR